ncbi:MAG: TIGR02588 family protein [Thainema sp.]
MAEQRDPTEQPIRTQQSRSESPEDAASNSTTDSTADSATRDAAEAPTSPPVLRLGQRSKAEWVTFIVSILILLSLVGLVIFDWVVNQDRPPAFQIEVTQTARITDERYYVPFVITNTGGRIARTVQVTAELHVEGEPDETGEQQIDFLSGQERKRGSFIFTHNPQSGELVLRVASYRLP